MIGMWMKGECLIVETRGSGRVCVLFGMQRFGPFGKRGIKSFLRTRLVPWKILWRQ